MSLLLLSKAVHNSDEEKSLGVLSGQVTYITSPARFHTLWTDLAAYSSLADEFATTRRNPFWYMNKVHDDWGRIRRTQLWG